MRKPTPTTLPVRKVVVDESVSDTELEHFRSYAIRTKLYVTDWLLVRETHRGIPDSEILLRLLDASTVLLTNDRPFHNAVLSKGLRSFHIDGHTLTSRPLPHIRASKDLPNIKKDRPLRDDYTPAQHPLMASLMPESDRALKRVRTARRRIRNHFGGLENLDQVAVTVSWRPLGRDCLIGVRLQVSGKVGLPAIRGSESYILETLEQGERGSAALCHALVLVVQLTLHSLEVVVYHDLDRIPTPPTTLAAQSADGFAAMFGSIRDSFEHLTLVPVAKGRHLESLRKKLEQLAGGRTNEIQRGRLFDQRRRMASATNAEDVVKK